MCAEGDVVGVPVLRPAPADDELRRAAEDGAHRRVHSHRDALEIGDGGADRRLLEADLEPGLRLLGAPLSASTRSVSSITVPAIRTTAAVVAELGNRMKAQPSLFRVGADDAEVEVDGMTSIGGIDLGCSDLRAHRRDGSSPSRALELGATDRVDAEEASELQRPVQSPVSDIELEAAEVSGALRLGKSSLARRRACAARRGAR